MAWLPPASEGGFFLFRELVVPSLAPWPCRTGSLQWGNSCWAIRKTTLWQRARCPAIRVRLELVELQGTSGHLQQEKAMREEQEQTQEGS